MLSVRNLSIEYQIPRGSFKALRNASFDLKRGEILALIGESGSGKSTLGFALINMNNEAANVTSGQVIYRRKDGSEVNVANLSPRELRHFRWTECAMVFQAAQNAFNPVMRISEHFLDTARAHGETDRPKVMERAAELCRMVQLDPARVLPAYSHELSGGMRQRVLLAMSLLMEPEVLILDEPTTALDVLTQRSIIDLLRGLHHQLGFSMVIISHDLALAAELADRVATVYAGTIVELGPVVEVFHRPVHPYTVGLLGSVPTLEGDSDDLMSGDGIGLIRADLSGLSPQSPFAADESREEDPALETVAADHQVACFHWNECWQKLSGEGMDHGSSAH